VKFLKSLLMGTGGVVLAGLVLAVIAPKAAHAIAATAVQVVNTSSSPVPNLDVERNARVPYQSSVGGGCTTPCTLSFAAVPAGYRLVAQYFSAYAQSPGNSTPVEFRLGGGTPTFLGPVVNEGFTYDTVINQPMTAYFDAGTPTAFVSGGSGWFGAAFGVLVGYLENCAVSSCPAIQQ
jgi:hypothetical protein